MFPYLMTGAAIAGGIYFTYQNCCKRRTSRSHALYHFTVEASANPFDFSNTPANVGIGQQDSIGTLYNALHATLKFFQDESYLKEEGIFRLSGDLNKAKSTHTLMRKMTLTYLNTTDTNHVISTLKLALEEAFVASRFLTIELSKLPSKPVGSRFKDHIQYLLDMGKTKEAFILHNLLYLLSRVYAFRADNKMGCQKGDVSNIATVMSPAFMKLLGMPEAASLTDPSYASNKAAVSRMIDQLIVDPQFAKPFHECVSRQVASSHFRPR